MSWNMEKLNGIKSKLGVSVIAFRLNILILKVGSSILGMK